MTSQLTSLPLATREQAGRFFDVIEGQFLKLPRQVLQQAISQRGFLENFASNHAALFEALLEKYSIVSPDSYGFVEILEEPPVISIMRPAEPYDRKIAMEALRESAYFVEGELALIEAMPRFFLPYVELHFVKLQKFFTDEELDLECQRLGYSRLATPYELASVNENEKKFSRTYPNGTHWKDENGKWCYLLFDSQGRESAVKVYRNDDGWDEGYWIPFVPKIY